MNLDTILSFPSTLSATESETLSQVPHHDLTEVSSFDLAPIAAVSLLTLPPLHHPSFPYTAHFPAQHFPGHYLQN